MVIKIAPARENRFGVFIFVLPEVSAFCTVSSKKKKKMLTPEMLGSKTCNRFVIPKKMKFEVMRGLFS